MNTTNQSMNTIVTLENLPALLTKHARLLGLDLGSKTVGLALCDVSRKIATPMVTLKRGKFSELYDELHTIIVEQDIGALVIGMPLNIDGSEGPRAQATRAFCRNFAAKNPLPIVFWDERLSTVAVERTLLEADTSRKKRSEVIDKMAAAYILQGALDRLAQLPASPE